MFEVKTHIRKGFNGTISINATSAIAIIIIEFLESYDGVKVGYNTIFSEFSNSYTLREANDFCDDSFFEQYNYFKSRATSRGLNGLVRFYSFLIERDLGRFDNITIGFLKYKDLLTKLNDGYELLCFSPYFIPKTPDKCLIDFTNYNSDTLVHTIYSLNLSEITSSDLKRIFFHFVWYYKEDYKYKQSKNYPLLNFLKILDNESYNRSSLIEISHKNIIEFKKVYLRKLSATSQGAIMSRIRQFVDFESESKNIKINRSARSLMRTFGTKSEGDVRAYKKEEIEMIISQLMKWYVEFDELYYFIAANLVQLQMLTPIRATTLMKITIDHIKEIQPGSFIISIPTKEGVVNTYNITKNVKNIFLSSINLTLNELPDSERTRTPIYSYVKKRGKRRKSVKLDEYSELINRASKEHGYMQLGQTGVRNFFHSSITEYAINRGNGKELIAQLSKHSITTHMKHYDNSDLYNLISTLFEVEIGDLNFSGHVDNSYISSGYDNVNNDCGFCSNSKCTDFSAFDCLLCQHFVTTIAHQKTFEKEIEKISNIILDENIEHEKEFLVAKKKTACEILDRA